MLLLSEGSFSRRKKKSSTWNGTDKQLSFSSFRQFWVQWFQQRLNWPQKSWSKLEWLRNCNVCGSECFAMFYSTVWKLCDFNNTMENTISAFSGKHFASKSCSVWPCRWLSCPATLHNTSFEEEFGIRVRTSFCNFDYFSVPLVFLYHSCYWSRPLARSSVTLEIWNCRDTSPRCRAGNLYLGVLCFIFKHKTVASKNIL